MPTFRDMVQITDICSYYHYFFDNTHRFDGHRHNCWELNIVRSGELIITYGDTVFHLHPGELFLGEPRIFHRNAVYATGTTELVVLMFQTEDIPLIGTARLLELGKEGELLLHLLIDQMDPLSLPAMPFSPETELPYTIKILWEALLLYVLLQPVSPHPIFEPGQAIYQQAVTFMNGRLNQSLTLSEIAAACFVSPTTLKRIFTQYTGRGVITYFTELKMEAARGMLPKASSIAQVAETLGFSSASHFSQVFRRYTGITPRAARSTFLRKDP